MKKSFLLFMTVAALTGCGTIAEKTAVRSDDALIEHVARSLGFKPEEITLISRNNVDNNNFLVVKAKNGKQYACTIKGGNLFTMFVPDAPDCKPR